MRRVILIGAAAAMLGACSGEAPDQNRSATPPDVPQPSGPPMPNQGATEAPSLTVMPTMAWESIAGGEGTALRLTEGGGDLRMSIACLSNPPRLVVNVPAFEPVMSEDRFALGLGPEPVTLVADPYDQKARPGVTGEGPTPDNFAALMEDAAEVRALYGAQQTGPYPAPAPALKRLLIEACRNG